jgi:hypothetical protein
MLLPADIAGRELIGASAPLIGAARNLNLTTAFDSVEAAWEYDGYSPDQHDAGLYIDGELRDRVAATRTRAAAAGLTDGLHTVTIAFDRSLIGWGERRGHPLGQRAYVRFARSTDSTTRSYRVYSDGGLGGDIDQLAGASSQITVQGFSRRLPMSGSGLGRASIAGTPAAGDVLNAAVAIEITGSGLFDYAVGAETGSSIEFAAGDTIGLPHNVNVTFHDDAEDYQTGDTWSAWIGPQPALLTAQLAVGVHRFVATALDAAGNESEPLTLRAVRIVRVPEAINSIAIAHVSGQINVTWNNAELYDAIRVYSNWSRVFNVFLPYVDLTFPHATLDGDTTEWTFDPGGVEGQLMFYARPVLDGIEREEFALQSTTFPPTPIDQGYVLGQLFDLKLEARAGGDVMVSTLYRFAERDSLHHVAIYVVAGGTNPNTIDWQSPDIEIARAQAVGYPVAGFAAISEPHGDAEVLDVYVRAAADAGNTILSDYLVGTVTTDAAPPSFGPGRTLGAPQ